MNRKLAAQCLSELGNLTRLDIYRLLVRGGLEGMKISDIQARLGVPASTLAFHLGGLVGVGLVSQEKVGREVICRAKHRQLPLDALPSEAYSDRQLEVIYGTVMRGFARRAARVAATLN
jgi:ArsR family transcriptional regulator